MSWIALILTGTSRKKSHVGNRLSCVPHMGMLIHEELLLNIIQKISLSDP